MDCKKNTKELFCLVNKLTGDTTQNLLPLNKTDEELAEDCVKVFLSKIEKIRGTFINKPAYKAAQCDTPKFASFHPLTEVELHAVIMTIRNKHFEIYII